MSHSTVLNQGRVVTSPATNTLVWEKRNTEGKRRVHDTTSRNAAWLDDSPSLYLPPNKTGNG